MKQNAIKQVLMLMLLVVLSVAGSSALFFPISSLNAPNRSCSVNSKIYLNQDSDTDNIPDYYLYLRSNFRIPEQNPPEYHAVQLSGNSNNPGNPNSTRIYYYASDTNVLSKRQSITWTYQPLDNSTFYKASRVFPFNQRVRGIDTNDIRILFERPLTTGNSNVVSIVYSYKYETAVGYRYTHPPTPTYRYNAVASGGDFHGLTLADYVDRNTSKERRRSSIMTSTTCKNYLMHRCGDGITDSYVAGERVNSFTGETCDDAELNGTPGHCNATCTSTWSSLLPRCGDNIIQLPGTTPYDGNNDGIYDPADPNEVSFEECDDGDLIGDNGDGLLNGDDISTSFCSSICLPNFAEEFVEEFINE